MKTKGYICTLFASISWGTVFVVGRFILSDENVNPVILVFLRCMSACIFLLNILILHPLNIPQQHPPVFL
ncbi:MAG: EamA family transporter [bacterium]|nr:EamA family transporter [bacterium]